MDIFGRKKQAATRTYDKENLTPVIRASICTGEQVAGFQNKCTGKFQEVTLIRSEEDLAAFRALYGIEGEIRIIY